MKPPVYRLRKTSGLSLVTELVEWLGWLTKSGLIKNANIGTVAADSTGRITYDLRPAVGAVGDTGPVGIEGATGPAGPKGNDFIGETGDKGDKGPKGDPGDKGDAETTKGPTGPDGVKGAKGDKGDQGNQGDVGPAGDDAGVSAYPGPQGPKGITGPPGQKLAIVPITTPAGAVEYRAFHVLEAPRFEFLEFIDVVIPAHTSAIIQPISPRYLATLDPRHALELRSVWPLCRVEIRDNATLAITRTAGTHRLAVQVRLQLAGIARGHGERFPQFTAAQRQRNAAKWASALEG